MTLAINGVRLDDPKRTYIIAEMSGNHAQDYAKAEALVHAAAEAGADAIKAQLITPELICADIPLPFGHNPAHDAWLRSLGVTRMRELFAHGGLPRAWCAPLKQLAERLGIAWLCTPFSVEEARFLVEDVGVAALKIASGDLTFTPLLEYAASTHLPIILSTGGAYIEEITLALSSLGHQTPWEYVSHEHVALLHCVSVYPCPSVVTNLRAISTLYKYFISTESEYSYWGGAIGFSDHTLSVDVVPVLAVGSGYCTVYEKHLCLAEDDTSIDAAHSLTPAQFRQMVEVIRSVPQILGDGVKQPHALEAHDRLWARRGSDGLRPTDAAREGVWA